MKKYIKFLIIFLVVLSLSIFVSDGKAGVQDEIAERQRQIEELQRQINEYQSQIDITRGQSRTLENEIGKLNAKINQITLEIRGLELSVSKTKLEIGETEKQIGESEQALEKHKNALAQYLKIAYQNDQITLTEILFNNENLSDFFNYLNDLANTQDNLKIAIQNIRQLKTDLEDRQISLEGKKTDLEHLIGIQAVQKRSLDINKKEKDTILKETKGQESKFQELIQKSQRDIEKIREQLTFLTQHGITAEDAVRYAQLAAIRAGIRPAFLLAILEIESRLGQNVGSGNWQDDMVLCYRRLGDIWYPHRRTYYYQRAATEEAAFLKITSQLGIDPNSVKVSREPNYGCGGAMGPAQFIPSTWLAYAEEVARLTGHNPPNPWSIEDAFMASAIKLANGGADKKTRTAESGAARAYIGGSTKCSSSICNYYSRTVLNKADEIEKNL
ncbi:MAG: lytic murein transglycosylase [Candidatus Yanofskybacteria bacterium]|nr:lytic murein transglycosylase [Candidatus Yanofskybacteria bacterium]